MAVRLAEREFVREELTLAERLREEMVAWDAAFRAAFRLPPYNPDEILRTRGGYDLFEKMMTDAQVRASINTKRYALLARPWQLFPAVRDQADPRFLLSSEACEFVEYALRNLRGPDGSLRDFRQTLFELMSAFYRGFSLAEMIWRIEERGRWQGRYALAAIKFKNPKQIGFELDEFLNVRAITSLAPGSAFQTIPRNKCLLYVYNAKDEMPYGDSDLRTVYKHYYSKEKLMEMWNLRLQRFGVPFAYATASNSGDAKTREIADALAQLQQDSSAVFPLNTEPKVLQVSAAGDDTFLAALEWHNQQIAMGILLQTLTSSEGRRSGSMALGRVHFDILLFALECMKQDIESAVNSQIVRPLIDYNFDHGLYPRFSLGNLDEKDLLRLAQAMNVLLTHQVVGAKEPILREMFNLPPLEEGAE